MPNRIIHDRCRYSKTLEALTAEEERFFWRLIASADDFGRFPSDPILMLGLTFPRRAGVLAPGTVGEWYAALEREGLVRSYVAEDNPFGFFTKWDKYQRRRAKHSKYPAPPDAGHVPASGGHLPAGPGQVRPSTRNEERGTRKRDNTASSIPKREAREERGTGGHGMVPLSSLIEQVKGRYLGPDQEEAGHDDTE